MTVRPGRYAGEGQPPVAGPEYDAIVGAGLLGQLGTLVKGVIRAGARRAMIVRDTGVPEELGRAARASLEAAGLTVSAVELAPTEIDKSLASVERVLLALASSRHERWDPVIALGGGIVGDLAGFAAAIYRRGVPVVQCPTTLLSMVDASVGGKTGANLASGASLKKNLIGAFHQPALVVADVQSLRSLPERTLRAGLAECLKHGLLGATLGDAGLEEFTARALPGVLAREPEAMIGLVARNVALKASVVQHDEREEAPNQRGGRALLNLGHTFGHAVETLPGLRWTGADGKPRPNLEHGEAVALGLVAAYECAARLGWVGAERAGAIARQVVAAGLPDRAAGLPVWGTIAGLMGDDKKVSGGVLRLVLPRDEGAGERIGVVDVGPALMDAVRAGLIRIGAGA
ncbi:MAG: 3-dehydroquinate synthase family protein [Planctomycetota bacterium]|nr:3-dehydroquinate synthase family protein [Planctomycetota bacterium]